MSYSHCSRLQSNLLIYHFIFIRNTSNDIKHHRARGQPLLPAVNSQHTLITEDKEQRTAGSRIAPAHSTGAHGSRLLCKRLREQGEQAACATTHAASTLIVRHQTSARSSAPSLRPQASTLLSSWVLHMGGSARSREEGHCGHASSQSTATEASLTHTSPV